MCEGMQVGGLLFSSLKRKVSIQEIKLVSNEDKVKRKYVVQNSKTKAKRGKTRG